MDDLYLGHNTSFWLELKKKVEKLEVTDWLQEIADLRGKVSYYESRIGEMNKFMNKP